LKNFLINFRPANTSHIFQISTNNSNDIYVVYDIAIGIGEKFIIERCELAFFVSVEKNLILDIKCRLFQSTCIEKA